MLYYQFTSSSFILGGDFIKFLIILFFVFLFIQTFICLYFFYTFVEVKFFHHQQGSKLKIKKDSARGSLIKVSIGIETNRRTGFCFPMSFKM